MIDPILDPILVPVRDRLRQQQAAIRNAQALADHWQGVANQQRAEIERLKAGSRMLQRFGNQCAAHNQQVWAENEELRGNLTFIRSIIRAGLSTIAVNLLPALDLADELYEAALAWRAAISVPDGVQAAEAQLLAALKRIDEASEG